MLDNKSQCSTEPDDDLIEDVIDQVMEDVFSGHFDPLKELLKNTPKDTLLTYLEGN